MKAIYKFALLCTFLFSANVLYGQTSEREKGIDLYNQGEYQKTVEILQTVVKADKNDETAWLYLGMSLARTKESSSAAGALRKADHLSAKNKNPISDNMQKPVKIISKPRAPYTDDARRNQIQGIIKIAVEFGADGRIKGVFPFQTLSDGLTENCVKSANEIKFEPAVKDGKPISMIKIISYSFEIY